MHDPADESRVDDSGGPLHRVWNGREVWRRRIRRSARRLPPLETGIAMAVGLLAWTILAANTDDYILPPLTDVGGRIVELFADPDQRWNWMLTIIRVMLGLTTSFGIGLVLGLAMGRSRRMAGVFLPYLQIAQGIPSLAWVIIAIIWFQTVEVRVWFLLLMVTLPGFAFQTQDSYRAIPAELQAMARSLRPRRARFDMFRTITLPAIIPDLLTAWKVNLGLGTRVVLIAEFAGATVGVGYQLLQELQFFRMSGVIAWTASLVIFVLVVQQVIALAERRLLRYRPGASGEQPHTGGNGGAGRSDATSRDVVGRV